MEKAKKKTLSNGATLEYVNGDFYYNAGELVNRVNEGTMLYPEPLNAELHRAMKELEA